MKPREACCDSNLRRMPIQSLVLMTCPRPIWKNGPKLNASHVLRNRWFSFWHGTLALCANRTKLGEDHAKMSNGMKLKRVSLSYTLIPFHTRADEDGIQDSEPLFKLARHKSCNVMSKNHGRWLGTTSFESKCIFKYRIFLLWQWSLILNDCDLGMLWLNMLPVQQKSSTTWTKAHFARSYFCDCLSSESGTFLSSRTKTSHFVARLSYKNNNFILFVDQVTQSSNWDALDYAVASGIVLDKCATNIRDLITIIWYRRQYHYTPFKTIWITYVKPNEARDTIICVKHYIPSSSWSTN